jgi:predicted CDP-diglyceride synthetase/phosphatidate cytidylyltransferase
VASYGLWERGEVAWGSEAYWIAWAVALLVPLLAALALDARRAVWNGVAIAWTLMLAVTGSGSHGSIAMYCWCAIGAAGLAAWGIHDGRAERVNLGVAGLAITVLAFYFSSVMDKLGRSASLIGIGLLFLGGGWVLERTRQRLLTHMSKEAL